MKRTPPCFVVCLEGFPKRVPRSTKEKVRYICDIPMDEIGTDVESCIGIPEGVIEGLSRNRKEPSGVIMAGYLGQDRGGGIQ